MIVRSVSEEPRLVLRGRAPVEIGTGDARRIRASGLGPIPAPFRFGLPGQLASMSGSEMGTEVPLLDTVDDASESEKKYFLTNGLAYCYTSSCHVT